MRRALAHSLANPPTRTLVVQQPADAVGRRLRILRSDQETVLCVRYEIRDSAHDDEDVGAAKSPAPGKRRLHSPRWLRSGLGHASDHYGTIQNGNRGSIVTMRRSVMDRFAASSACADTSKLFGIVHRAGRSGKLGDHRLKHRVLTQVGPERAYAAAEAASGCAAATMNCLALSASRASATRQKRKRAAAAALLGELALNIFTPSAER